MEVGLGPALTPPPLRQPITLAQVTQFAATTPATLQLADGSLYYGQLHPQSSLPHGLGVILFKHISLMKSTGAPTSDAATSALNAAQPHTSAATLLNATLSTSKSFAAGDRYGGFWKDGRFQGEGVLLTSTFSYHGGWEAGYSRGSCRMSFSKGYIDAVTPPAVPSPISRNDLEDSTSSESGARGVGSLLLRGLSYLSPFDEGQPRPKSYEGMVEANYCREGLGTMSYHNGDVYEGNWHLNARQGHGKLQTSDGEVYEGAWVCGQRHGYGKVLFPDGSHFKGMFHHNSYEGEGVMRFCNGDSFFGQFHHSRIDGQGTMRYSNGDIYDGSWKGGLRHGPGKYTLHRTGATMEGSFVHGLIHGEGTLELPGISTFVGNFMRGERNFGTMVWHDLRDPVLRQRRCYQGEWAGEEMNGKGLMWYRNGDFYFGEFVKGKRHGEGNIRYADGSEFSGYFYGDHRHGTGIEQKPDGSIRSGRWYAGHFVEGYEGEWDGNALNGVGRLKLPLHLFFGDGNTRTSGASPSFDPANVSEPARDSGGSMESLSAAANSGDEASFVEYFGLFRDGLRDGAGMLKIPALGGTTPPVRSGRSPPLLRRHIIRGRWDKDVLECDRGVWAFPSGEVYVGGFQQGLRHGALARMWLPDGSVFVGEWKHNAPCGSGTFFAKSLREPIHRRIAPSTSMQREPSALPETPDAAKAGNGVMDYIWSIFSRATEETDATKNTEVQGTSGSRHRVLIGYRDAYQLAAQWQWCGMSTASYTSLVLPQVQHQGPVVSAHAVTIVGDAVHGSPERPPAKPLPAGAIEPFKAASIRPPTSYAVGRCSGTGILRYASGVEIFGRWADNAPSLVVPHRPGSYWDRYLHTLRQPPTLLPPEQPIPRDQSPFAQRLAAAALLDEWPPLGPDTVAPASTSMEDVPLSDVLTCTVCHKAFTFFRRPTHCTLCTRSACAACLGTIGDMQRPDATAALMRGEALLQRLNKGGDVRCGSTDFSVDPLTAKASTANLLLCADCVRVLLMRVTFQTMWIPLDLFSSVVMDDMGSPPKRPASTGDKAEEANFLAESPRRLGQESELSLGGAHPTTQLDANLSAPADVTDGIESSSSSAGTSVVTPLKASNGTCMPEGLSPAPTKPEQLGSVQSQRSLTVETEPSDALPAQLPLRGRSVVYHGYTANGYPHLWGQLWYGSSSYYEGGFVSGKRSGFGVQYLHNGEKYEGTFRSDHWHGEGRYYAEDGSVLHGDFERGQLCRVHYHGEIDAATRRPHGRGVSYHYGPTGRVAVYNGEWRHGQRHGTGMLDFPHGTVYSGTFQNGEMEGIGKLVSPTSAYYGGFQRGQKHGSGVEYFFDSAVQGNWECGLAEGLCRVYDTNTDEVYEATYCNGNERDDCFMKPVMVSDADSVACAQCGTSFSLFVRRHHCRLCGEVVCDSCSRSRAVLPNHFTRTDEGGRFTSSPPSTPHASVAAPPAPPERVCDDCFQRLEQRRSLAIRHYADGSVYAGLWSGGQWVSRGVYCRKDGLFILMDSKGRPLVGTKAQTSEGKDAASDGSKKTSSFSRARSDLVDAAPPRKELDRLTLSSSRSDMDAFVLWWSSMLSSCQLSVLLDVPLLVNYHRLRGDVIRGADHCIAASSSAHSLLQQAVEESVGRFPYPAPPTTEPLRLFVTIDPARRSEERGSNGPAATASDDDVQAARLRAARYAPAVIPPKPPPRADVHNQLCPELIDFDFTEAELLTAVKNDRIERFLAFPPPSQVDDQPTTHEDPTRMILLTCYDKKPLLPPTPPIPSGGPLASVSPAPTPASNDGSSSHLVRWSDWSLRPVPRFRPSAGAASPGASSEAALFFSCPFWRPGALPVLELLEQGKMKKAQQLLQHMERHESSSEDGSRSDLSPNASWAGGSTSEAGASSSWGDWMAPFFSGAVADGEASRRVMKKSGLSLRSGTASSGWLPAPLLGPFRFDVELMDRSNGSSAGAAEIQPRQRTVVVRQTLVRA